MPRSKTKTSGKTPGTTPRTVYKRPYWFDRGRSLCELHGWPRSGAGDGVGLLGRYTAAVNRPVGRLDELELAMLFGQGTDPHYLVPVALDLLRDDSSAWPGLLPCLLRLDAAFWRDHPVLQAQLVALVNGRLANMDDNLADEVRTFVERHRVR
jgi:hypothetical protein